MERAPILAVIGPGEAEPVVAERAEAVGREVASAGATLICGGLGGVMAAACRGARSRGGRTIGVLPGDSVDEANEWVEVPIATGLGEARNLIVVRSADAVIAVGGRYGTLIEIAFALHHGRPIVGLGTWRLEAPGLVHPVPLEVAVDAADAVERALAAAGC